MFAFFASSEDNDFLDIAQADVPVILVILQHVHHHPTIGGVQDGEESIVYVCIDQSLASDLLVRH